MSNYYRNRNQRNDSTRTKGTSVEVRNNDVNHALRKLKKILENDNRQKELAKREYFEKSSVKRKRSRDVAKKRWQREVTQKIQSGAMPLNKCSPSNVMHSKRKRRAVSDRENLLNKSKKARK